MIELLNLSQIIMGWATHETATKLSYVHRNTLGSLATHKTLR